MKRRLLLAVLSLAVLAACSIRKPFVREEDPWIVRGTRAENGDELISRHVLRPYMISVTPIGRLDGDDFSEYALRARGKIMRLEFLDEEARRGPKPPYNREILPIPRTDRWAALRVEIHTRDTVELTVVIFNRDGIHTTRIIPEVRRQFPLRLNGPNGCMVSLDDETGQFQIDAIGGNLRYDPVRDSLTRIGS
jgi:hypothetical protein